MLDKVHLRYLSSLISVDFGKGTCWTAASIGEQCTSLLQAQVLCGTNVPLPQGITVSSSEMLCLFMYPPTTPPLSSSSIYLPLYQGHLTPAVVQTRDGLSTRLLESTITTTPLSLSITLLQTRNGYDIWLQAEKQRVRSLIDKFWHFSLPRPQLWRHYNPTDYHRAYTILLQKIIWYDWWKVG